MEPAEDGSRGERTPAKGLPPGEASASRQSPLCQAALGRSRPSHTLTEEDVRRRREKNSEDADERRSRGGSSRGSARGESPRRPRKDESPRRRPEESVKDPRKSLAGEQREWAGGKGKTRGWSMTTVCLVSHAERPAGDRVDQPPTPGKTIAGALSADKKDDFKVLDGTGEWSNA